MGLDLSSDKLYRVFVTLFELVKLKRGTHQSRWGKWEGNHFANNGSCLSLPLNMALVYTSCQPIGYSSDLHDDPLSWAMSILWVFQKNSLSTVALCVCPVQSCCQVFLSCRPMFKGDLKKFYLCSLHSLCVSIFESVIWLLHSHHSRTMFRVSCHRCGTHHGPPSMRLFPSTSAHHPRNSLRNEFSTLISICLNDIFSFSQHSFTSLTFDC